jgi:antitoxin MazE
MLFNMKVFKWGNSLAVRLPVALIQELGISAGDEIELLPSSNRTQQSLNAAVKQQPTKLTQLLVARKYRKAWPANFSFDREDVSLR